MNDSTHKQDGGLTGQVLLAMPSMIDPRFERSVICMCAHNDEGAMGIVINKTLDSIDFRELLRELGIKSADTAAEVAVHFGGPVERQRGFVLHSTDYHHPDTMVVDDKVALTATLDV
ncbi:MAG: YqgE/AlgH family protein, partial [Alphaproteobacteria bacterium]